MLNKLLNKMLNKKSISHLGDIAAIPFFFLLISYFYYIENKTPFEWILYLFCIVAFLADLFFTYIFFYT
jgi:hypothetical protein